MIVRAPVTLYLLVVEDTKFLQSVPHPNPILVEEGIFGDLFPGSAEGRRTVNETSPGRSPRGGWQVQAIHEGRGIPGPQLPAGFLSTESWGSLPGTLSSKSPIGGVGNKTGGRMKSLKKIFLSGDL